MIRTYWLVVSATEPPRVRTKRPTPQNLTLGEIAVPLTIKVPDGWGKVLQGGIEVQMPEPPEVDGVGDFVTGSA